MWIWKKITQAAADVRFITRRSRSVLGSSRTSIVATEKSDCELIKLADFLGLEMTGLMVTEYPNL